MREVQTGSEAMMFIGQQAKVNGVDFMVAGFSTRNGVTFVLRHKNGMEMRMDATSCLACVTVDGKPMGVDDGIIR